MSKSCRSPDVYHLKAKAPKMITPKTPKMQGAVQAKQLAIKLRIHDLITQKKKIQSSISLVQKTFKKSQKKEQELNILSLSIESRILNLEKRANILKIRKKSLKKSKIRELVSLLNRLKELSIQEKELDELEEELNNKQEDLSIETRSSESTQPVIITKDSFQKQFLRNSLCKIEYEEENINKHSELRKMQKEMICNMKEGFDLELKKFELSKELWKRKFSAVDVLRQKVQRKKQIVEEEKKEIEDGYGRINEIYKENDFMIMEIKNLKKQLGNKKKRTSLEILKEKAEEKEEVIEVLRESCCKREAQLRIFKAKLQKVEEKLGKTLECIKCKNELMQVLNEIEGDSIEKPKIYERKTEDNIKIICERQEKFQNLTKLALEKEKEIFKLESEIKMIT